MRKNAPRKWLHAILDLLPVILIPVFMIYSHRHTIDSGSIEFPQNQVVDFNQVRSNNYISGSIIQNVSTYEIFDVTSFDYHVGHKYLTRVNYDFDGGVSLQFRLGNPSYSGYSFYLTSNLNTISYIGEFVLSPVEENNNIMYFQVFSSGDLNLNYYDLNVFDLTQMFGSGNEPTIQQFNEWYSEPYYEYTLSHKELLKGTSIITYDDTDIMSQSLYQLYNSVDKYFNMNNVFNMGNVYDWFNLNIFNGNAPIIMYIVWNIALYELVMDLMFLLYALFMWFVDWCKSLIERTYDVGRGR